jgi:chemotaxis protein CheX
MNTIKENAAENDRLKSWTPLLEISAQEVFSLMVGADVASVAEPVCREGLDVTSMVGFAGSLRGILTLKCSADSAALMASKMLGIDTAAAGPHMLDVVSEICNMVAGNFKNKITGLGDGCKLSVPTVITGEDYSLYSLGDDCRIEINLLFEGLPLILSLKLDS